MSKHQTKLAQSLFKIYIVVLFLIILAVFNIDPTVSFFNNVFDTTASEIKTTDWTPPPVPTLLSPANNSSTNSSTLVMDWTDEVDDMSSPVYYIYQRSTDEAFSLIPFTSGHLSASQYPEFALAEGVYWWRVRACDALNNCSDWTLPWKFTVDNTPPSNPIFWVEEDASQVKIDWQLASGATGYKIYRSQDNVTFVEIAVTGNVSTYTDSSVSGNSNYYYKVSAIDDANNESSIVSVTGKYAGTMDIVVDDDSAWSDFNSSGTVSKAGQWDVYSVNNVPSILQNATGGDNYSTNYTPNGQTYSWITASNLAGYYDVYVQYICDPARNVASYEVFDGVISRGTKTIDQRKLADQVTNCSPQPTTSAAEPHWAYLGNFEMRNHQASITLNAGTANGYILADAVGFKKTGNLESLRFTTYTCAGNTNIGPAQKPNASGDAVIPSGCKPVSGQKFGYIFEQNKNNIWPMYPGLVDNTPFTQFDGETGIDGVLKVNDLQTNGRYDIALMNKPNPISNNQKASNKVVLGMLCTGDYWPAGNNYELTFIPPSGSAYCIAYLKEVVINEFLPNPSGNDNAAMPHGEWVELYNNSDASIDVNGWYLYDAVNSHALAINATNSLVKGTPDVSTTIIPSKGFLVVYRNGDSDFELNNTIGDSVRLYNNQISTGGQLIDSHTYLTLYTPINKTYARIPDGTGNFVDPDATPGEPNEYDPNKTFDSSLIDEEDKALFPQLTPDNIATPEPTITITITPTASPTPTIMKPVVTMSLSENKDSLSFSVTGIKDYVQLSYKITNNDTNKSLADNTDSPETLNNQDTFEAKGIILMTCSSGVCTEVHSISNVKIEVTLKDKDNKTLVIDSTL